MLGISRIAVFKKIKKGEIKASKYGRQYLIAASDLPTGLGSQLNTADRATIEAAVKKTVAEYAETLKLLGQE